MTNSDPGHAPRLGDPAAMRLRQPADVLGVIPYLLGYYPAECVIVAALRGTRLVFTMTYDLPAVDAPRRDIREMIDDVVRAVLAHEVTAVLVLGYGTEERVRHLLDGLRRACERAALEVLEVLRAHQGRYWSYFCRDPVCCPPEGSPYDESASPVAAHATLAGHVVLPSREAYEAQVAPVVGDERDAMSSATARADQRLLDLVAHEADEEAALDALDAAGRVAIEEALNRQRTAGRLTDDEVAWLSVLLTSVSVRDIAWAQITGGRRDLAHHRGLWMDVMRRADPDNVAAPGCLFAFAAWRCGEASLARLALERVLDEHPDYTMAVMLDRALARGLSPATMKDWPGPGLSPQELSWRALRRRPGKRPRRRSSSRRAGTRPA